MARMPRRPAQHVLETESIRKFQDAIPSEWVFRPESPDYGVDGSVEVFEGGQATGLRFHVQIKATNKPSVETAKSVHLEEQTAQYFEAHDLPVLIASYHAPSGALYARWFNAIQPPRKEQEQGSRVFRLSESDRWTSDTNRKLFADLTLRRQVREGTLSLPLRFSLETKSDSIGSVPVLDVRNALLAIFPVLRDVLWGESGPNEGPVHIELRAQDVFVGLGCHYSVAVPLEDSGFDAQSIASEVLLALSMVLGRARLFPAMAKVARVAAEHSIRIAHPLAVERLFRYFTQGGRVIDALELSETLARRFGPAPSAEAFRILAMVSVGNLSRSEESAYSAYLVRRIGMAKKGDDSRLIAIAHYNLGNYLASRSRLREAFSEYARASRADATYWDRRYFNYELGGILFRAGRYRCAVRCYARAIDLGATGRVRAMFADALMFAGEYERARSILAEYVDQNEEVDAQWHLKLSLLDAVISEFGASQSREVERALRLHGELERVKENPETLDVVLRADALCGLAWYNRGGSANDRGERKLAGRYYLYCALCQPWDVEAWVNAFGLLHGCPGERDLAALTLAAAYRTCGERFVIAFGKGLSDSPSTRAEALLKLRSALAMLPPRREPLEMRLIEPDGSYRTIDLTREE